MSAPMEPRPAYVAAPLSEDARNDIEWLLNLARGRRVSHPDDGWADDFVVQVSALLTEVDRLTALVTQARAEERERAQSALEWLLIYRKQAIRGGHGPLAAEPEWITEAAGDDA